MKPFYFAILCILLTTIQKSFAQCPPPGFPEPGNTCPQAPILCENLDGYCAEINNNNQAQSFPGCPGWQLNNDEWFAFYAGTTTITMVVTPSNCTGTGNFAGLQAGIYDGCGGPSMDLQCACTDDPFTLTSTNFEVGHVYWMVIDGCAGDVCDYSIDVTEGSTVGAPPDDPEPITGPEEACQNSSTSYSIPPATGATAYQWTLTPPIGTVNANGTNATVTWNNNTTEAVLCVTASNLCYTNNNPSCITIDVIPTPTATLSGSGVICAGSSGSIDLTITFTGEGPWTVRPTLNGTPQAPIETSDNPYTLTVTQPGTWGLSNLMTVDGDCPGTTTGTATVTETNMNPTATTTPSTCGESNGSINLSPSGGNTPYTFEWSSGQSSEDLSNVPGGSYTVTITDEDGCTEALTVQLDDNTVSISLSATVVNNTTCTATGNGSIDLSPNPPGTYNYEWSNGPTSQDQTNLSPGTYIVTVSTGITCTATAEYTVDDVPNTPSTDANAFETTCDLSNGSIDLSVSGGVSPYTYNWSNMATTQDLANIPAGTYTVTVTGANQCTVTEEVTVTNNNPPINLSDVITPNTNCNGVGNGSINVTVTPPGSYTFTWGGGQSTEDLSNLLPGSYSLTVSSVGTCSTTADFDVPDEPNEPDITSNTVSSTCNLPNGSIDVSVSGGVSPYTYNWGGGQTSQDLTGLLAGSYDLTVTGANGCTSAASINVDNNDPPININANILPNTTCNGNFNGSIDVSVTPPGSYTYTWSGGQTSQDLTGLAPGSYTLTVNGGGTCIESETFTIEDQPNLPNPSGTTVESTCDLTNGSIDLTVSGGVTPYTYNWSNMATTQDLTNILAGAYTVTVTGANGCTSVLDFIVDNNNPPIDVDGNVFDNTNCNNNGNGSIDISVFPTGAYTYNWSTGPNSQDLNNLQPGTYTVTVTRVGTCFTVATFEVGNNPNNPELNFDVDNANCGLNNGSINLSVSASTAPYTYSWSSGQVTQDINNIPAGLYIVTVTGANGCTTADGVFVDDEVIDIVVFETVNPQTSCITNNGSIQLTASPNNVTYAWSTGSTSSSISGLAPGDYTVVVSAGGTCTTTQVYTVDDNTDYPGLTSDITPATCGLNNGSIDIDIISGIGPFTVKWSNGAMTQDLNNLPAGDYELTVTSAVGCSSVSGAFVPNNDVPISVFGYTVENTSCLAPNGSIILDVAPTLNYTYKWSNGSMLPTLQNLPAGVYTVTVSFGISCSASASFEVLNDANPPNLAAAATPSTCGLANGAADANPSGGIAPYSFLWSNSGNTEVISNLTTGPYTVTVTGSNGCSTTASVTVVNNNLTLNISGQPFENTSCTAGNGVVDISVNPPGTYTYNWSGLQTTEDISGLNAGAYTVTVSAGGSCTSSATFNVANNTVDPVLTQIITGAICNQPNGAIDLTVGSAPGPYVFAWSGSQSSEDLNGILPGNYSVTVSAGNGCTATATLNVPNNTASFSLSGTATPLTDCKLPNGAIDLVITPADTYGIAWSNGPTTEDQSGLAPGIYTVTVTKVGDCAGTASFVVEDQIALPASSQSISPEICGLANGAIDITVSGGQAPYTYSWESGQSSEDLNNIPAGSYTVTVTDANNCTTTAAATIQNNVVSFALSGTPVPNSSCVVINGAVDLSVSPADPGSGLSYTYNWSNAAQTQDIAGLPGGNYAVTVSAGGICENVASFLVPNNTDAPLVSGNISAASCGQSNGAVDISASAGQSPYSYVWSVPSPGEDLGAVPSGDYTVTVTGANGCAATETFSVPENVIIPSLTGTPIDNSSCVAPNGSVNLDVSPPGNYTFSWSNNAGTQNLSGIPAGDYTVTVNGGGDCIATATFNVDDDIDAVKTDGTTTDILCFGDNTGAIDLSIQGGQQPYNIVWAPAIPGNPEDLNNLLAGNYAVTVTDALGCSSSIAFSITQPAAALQISCAATAEVNEPGASDGAAAVSIGGGSAPYSVTWSPGGTQTGVIPGDFPIANLAVGAYLVTVTDANGCTNVCDFSVELVACETKVGSMSQGLQSLCGPGCQSGGYSALGQFLDPDDALQFVLHEGNGAQIVNEIARSAQPEFCFDAAAMSYGVTYYISAVAGDADASGNVILTDYCTVVAAGTPIVFYEKPVVNTTTPAVLNCVVHQVGISASSNLPGATFAWSTATGQIIGNASQATIQAGSDGLYTIIITVNGCSDTAQVAVNDITNDPIALIQASPDDILDCKIDEIILSGIVEGSLNANAVWYNNGQVYSNGNPVTIDLPGVYEFILVDTLTLCRDTAVIQIDENLAYPPLFLNTPGLLTCTNTSVTLSGGSPFPGIEFNWAFINGADTTILGNGASFAATTPGVYYLIGTDPANSCTNAISEEVLADVVLPVADAGDPFSIECYGGLASLDGTGSSGAPNLSFQWFSSDGSFVGAITVASPQIDEPGTYQLIVTNPGNGCTDIDNVVIAPKEPVATLSVDQPDCFGQRGTIVIESVSGAAPPVLYSISNGSVFSQQNVFNNLVAGDYTINIQDANGCETAVQASIIEPDEFQITVTASAAIHLGDSYQIDAQINVPLSAVSSVVWTPATGLNCDTCLNPVAMPLQSVQYKITVVTEDGCKDTAPLLLRVEKGDDVYAPNVFTPNGDGENDEFLLFANPKSVVNIKSMQIFSRWGELVFENYNFAPNDPALGWNGKFKGQELNPAVFAWYAVVEYLDGREVLYKGDVTIVR